MSSLATFAITRWIGDTLVADPALTGKVYNGSVPTGTAYPVCVYESVSNLTTAVVGGANVMNRAMYLVKVIGEGSGIGQLETMANAVYNRLHDATGSNAKGVVWACHQEEELDIPPDVVSGKIYRTLAQRFRIIGRGN